MNEPSGYVPNGLLSRLVGFRLCSVEFVMDYVQLRFDGPTDDMPFLNCDLMPVIETQAGAIGFGELGYTDALVALIPEEVVRATEAAGGGLRIEFSSGTVVLHPRFDDLVGPEIAYLSGFTDGQWMCWRPGEEPFEDLARSAAESLRGPAEAGIVCWRPGHGLAGPSSQTTR